MHEAAGPDRPDNALGTDRVFYGYGLRIRSEFELPELAADLPGPVDIDIRLGHVPDHLESVIASGVMFEAAQNLFLIKLPPLAKFLLTGGHSVVVDPYPGIDFQSVRGIMLADAIPPLLRQRGLLVLHAAGVLSQHGAVLVAGRSGAGKSTLMAELASRGHELISDDFSVVHAPSPGGFVVTPGLSRIKLWDDSARGLGLDVSGMRTVRPGAHRYFYELPSRLVGDVPLAALFILDTHEGSSIVHERLTGQRAFQNVRNQIRGLPAVDRLGLDSTHFAEIAGIAGNVPVYSIRRPHQPFAPGELADRVLELVG